MKTLALFFLLVANLSCQKEAIDLDQPIDRELKSVSGKGGSWGFNWRPPINRLSVSTHPPIVDSRSYVPKVATAVFKDKIWSLSNTHSYSATISNSKNGIDWTVVSTVPKHRVVLNQMVVFKNELWVGGYKAPYGASSSNLFKSSDGLHWEPVDNSPFLVISNMIAFKDVLYLHDLGTLAITESGREWSRFRSILPDPIGNARFRMVAFKDHLYLFTYSGIGADGTYFPPQVWKSVHGIKWRRVTHDLPSMWNRTDFSLTNYKGRLWLVGGNTTERSRRTKSYEIWYSDDAVSWKKFTGNNPIEAVSHHSATVFRDKLWLFGGNLDFYISGRPDPVSPTYEISF